MTGGAGQDSSHLGGSGFDEGLSAASHSIIAAARQALDTAKISDAEAVHDVRKALKRWRALMRLLAGPLGDPADQMRREARELMRALAGARDAQSALDALADLGKAEGTFSATSADTIAKRLTALRDDAEKTSFTAEMRERIIRYLDYATLSLERWPLQTIDFDIVADGLAATYRRARQLMPKNWREADPEHLHD